MSELLGRFRDNLLGTERNNRLVNFRSRTASSNKPIERVIEVIGEDPAQVFATLVSDQRVMTFQGQPDKTERGEGDGEEALEIEDWTDAGEANQADEKLTTPLQKSRLERHLTKIHRDQREMIEEQGVNALYLALGMMEWYEADHSRERRLAPLILVPVLLERTERGGFKLTWDGSDIGTNLSLAALLKKDFAIDLPPVPSEEIDVQKYANKVEATIRGQKDWAIHSDRIALAFFSFAKFLIFKDLAPASWPDTRNILDHPVLQALFKVTEFEEVDDPLTEEDDLDPHRPIGQTNEVFDADSSQTLAILQAQQGRSMVIEGPPGTGKSQTIANLIAEYVGQGKRVLFVSEKGAALNVVHDNLKRAKLHHCCLEVHGTKTNKRAFYAGLQNTVDQAEPRLTAAREALRILSTSRDTLNAYAAALHTQIGACADVAADASAIPPEDHDPRGEARGITPRDAIGRLLVLGPEPDTDGRLAFDWMANWTQEEFESKLELVTSLQAQLKRIGRPSHHAFAGSQRTYVSPDDKRELARRIEEAGASFENFRQAVDTIAQRLHLEPAMDLEDVGEFDGVVDFITTAPNTEGVNFKHGTWTDPELLLQTTAHGARAATLEAEFSGRIGTAGWTEDTTGLEHCILPSGASLDALEELVPLLSALDAMGSALDKTRNLANRISTLSGTPLPVSFWNLESLATIAKRLASAPDLRGLAVDNEKWLTEEPLLREALRLVKVIDETRTGLSGRISAQASEVNVDSALQTIEQEGSSLIKRWFGRTYRSEVAKVRGSLGIQEKLSHEGLVGLLKTLQGMQRNDARLTELRALVSELYAERWTPAVAVLEELTACLDYLVLLHGDVHKGKVEPATLQRLGLQDSLVGIGDLADNLRESMGVSAAAMDQYRVALTEVDGGAFESDTGDGNERLYRHFLDNVEPVMATCDRLLASKVGSIGWFDRLAVVSAIRGHQCASAGLESGRDTLVQCIGRARLEEENWQELIRLILWTSDLLKRVSGNELPNGLIEFFENGESSTGLLDQLSEMRTLRTAYSSAIDVVCCQAQLEGGGECFLRMPLDIQGARIVAWKSKVDELESFFRYNFLLKQVSDAGMEPVARLADTWVSAPLRLATEFQRGWYNGLLNEAIKLRPVLQEFDRKTHEEILESFRALDRKLIEYNRTKVALSHWRSVPRGSAVGEMGFLLLQINKKRGHKPIRTAMKEAPSAIQAVKPVFLMSPMSVAMYLPPEGPEFDVVIFDEASQIKPEDSLGSIVRAKQMIVVGDSRQMPPTSFFERMTGTDDGDFEQEDDLEAQSLGEQESILALASARIPAGSSNRRDLRWHYRSRHQDLISTSNRLFYKDRLVIFPHPRKSDSEMGLVFRHDPSTIYGRGGSRKNELEAKVVVQAVIKHVLQAPNLSLGIVAFSKAQQDAIEDQLDLARKNDPALRIFDEQHGLARLFVKNLETVQGDERDVIFISVGYGRDENGFLAMNFGPLNRDGGERRLNVLITRARIRTEVFSNFRSADMRMEDSKGEGVRAFHTFLAFAESGHLDAMPSALKPEPSFFEDCVFTELRNRGYDVDQQVGSENFYLDLAVRNPAEPGRYSIGIECDGRMYHSAKSARDRDRLRQQVLEDRGWRIHRIWSTDWWRHPERELERCVAAIEESFSFQGIATATPVEEPAPWNSEEDHTADQLETVEAAPSAIANYVQARPPRWLSGADLLRVSSWQLAEAIEAIVKVEAPIHYEEIVRRIREAAGIGRAGSQIRPHIEAAIQVAAQQGRVIYKKQFAYLPEMNEVPVRSRAQFPAQVKKIELIAPVEIEHAAILVLREAVAVEPKEIARPVANLLGFERVTPEIASHVLKILTAAVRAGRIEKVMGRLKLPASG